MDRRIKNSAITGIVIALMIIFPLNAQEQSIDLSGAWKVTLNTATNIEDNSLGNNKLKGIIQLRNMECLLLNINI